MENRQLDRELSKTSGSVVIDGVEHACTIYDRSVSGARLKDYGLTLPREFMLRPAPQSTVAVKCWLIWQDENEAGVVFIDPK